MRQFRPRTCPLAHRDVLRFEEKPSQHEFQDLEKVPLLFHSVFQVSDFVSLHFDFWAPDHNDAVASLDATTACARAVTPIFPPRGNHAFFDTFYDLRYFKILRYFKTKLRLFEIIYAAIRLHTDHPGSLHVMGFLCNAEIGVDILPYDLHCTPKWHCTAPRMTECEWEVWDRKESEDLHLKPNLRCLRSFFQSSRGHDSPQRQSMPSHALSWQAFTWNTRRKARCSWGMLRPTCQKHSKNRKVQAWLGMTTFWMAFDCYWRASGPLLKLYCSQECHQSPGSVQWRMSYIVSHCFTSHKGLRSRLHRFIVSSFHRLMLSR